MRSPIRTSSAAILVLALIVLPVARDQCSAFCESHRGAVDRTPSCHHTGSTAMRMGRGPTSCGHHHNATSPRISAGVTKPERVFHSWTAVLVASADASNASRELVLARRLPDDSSTSYDRSLPLRI